MPRAKFGKNEYRSESAKIKDELALIDTLTARLIENNITQLERARHLAQISLASSRIARALALIDQMAERTKET